MWKDESGAKMAHKGYNGRVIAFWLNDCMHRAVRHAADENRDFAKRFQETDNWPGEDDFLAPTAMAMHPS